MDNTWPLGLPCPLSISLNRPELPGATTSAPYRGPHGHAIPVVDVDVGVGGLKFDTGKPDLSLVPLSALEGMAKAFMVGEKKYGRGQYKKGFESHRLVAAVLRHVTAWNDGETLDPETGNNHLWHALASLAMLLECEKIGTLKDTRDASSV